MTDERLKETQQELFEEFSPAPKKTERFPSIAKTQKPILFSTTLEQLLMLSIVCILGLCGVFFLGVLRGKALREPWMAGPAAASRPVAVRVPQTVSQAVPGVSIAPAGKPAPVAPPVLNAEKPYTIQLVTHRKKEFAEAEVAAVRKLGYMSFIIPSGEYFQVCAGQYATKEAAKRDLSLFLTRYKDCFLRHR
jgi:hypothetical protein